MKIITLNANGIRSADRKGFFDWMLKQRADVVCLQEIKAQTGQLDDRVLQPEGYCGFFNSAEKKGYSGVALYARREPDNVENRLGWDSADREGRFLQADYQGFSVVSLYLPSGTSGDERQAVKYDFMARFEQVMTAMRRQETGVYSVRRLEHRAQGDRFEELAQQPEKFRLPARRTGLDGQGIRRAGYGRCVPRGEPGTGAIYLVVKPRPVLGKKCGMAYRLPGGDARTGAQDKSRFRLQGGTFL